MALSITTDNNITFSIMYTSMTTLSITTINNMTLSIINIIIMMTLSTALLADNQQYDA
jgi:hypothetical protein